ncbi:MAG: SDR family oxidoreductase, partial [Gammaproteobacteria bacterium]
MKLVITGALGHIGSRLSRHMATTLPRSATAHEIILIDNLLTQRYASLFELPGNINYSFLEMDVTRDELVQAFTGADVAIHLAAITDAASSFANSEAVEQNNFEATRRVAETCVLTGTRLIHLSSTSVYGTQQQTVDEFCSAEELKPQSPYAECKLREESLLRELGESQDLAFVICRFGTICGVSPGIRFHTAVNKFCWQAVMNQPITVWTTALHQKRPYLDLEDAMNAFGFIIENSLFDRQTYNVLTANHTVNDILESIRKHIPNLQISFVDTEIMNQLSYEVLNDRFREKGFAVTGSIEKSIEATIHLLGGI